MPLSWEQHLDMQENAYNWLFITKLHDDVLEAIEEFQMEEGESLLNKLRETILEEHLSQSMLSKRNADIVRGQVLLGPSRSASREFNERIVELIKESEGAN